MSAPAGGRRVIRSKSVENLKFNQDAAERASFDYGTTKRSIFTGEMLLKKMGNESSYKRRFIWIDAEDKSFHWSKVSNRTSPHKSVCLLTHVQDIEYRTAPAKYPRGNKPVPALCFSLILTSGDVIDIQVDSFHDVKEWETVMKGIRTGNRLSEIDFKNPDIEVPSVEVSAS